ncbi:MAG TPA: hypothetical protein VJC03_05225, partial [bacterium]|nr:hypothetical protein [bacterium]
VSYSITWAPSYDRYLDNVRQSYLACTMGVPEQLKSFWAGQGWTYETDSEGIVVLKGVAIPELYRKPFSGYYLDDQGATQTVLVSGVRNFELQERADTSPRWHTLSSDIPGNTQNFSVNEEIVTYEDGTPRPENVHYFYYRIRSLDHAGNPSEWSEISSVASIAAPTEMVTQVASYPNPVDVTKGVEETTVTYLLKSDSEVTITLYDLMGNLVREYHFSKGEYADFGIDPRTGNPRYGGGKKGVNDIVWDLTNDTGFKVAKGGYIMRIVVKSAEGTAQTVKKIAIIR